jgi:ATP-dependent Lhr-like helicase
MKVRNQASLLGSHQHKGEFYMISFELLSQRMQKKIWDMKWEKFTPVQDRTIPIIMSTAKDVIVSSGTASGKTEAVFLPIISSIESEAPNNFKVLYISPIKALINNQFERIEKLCEQVNIPVHKWHGDVNQSKKNKFIKKPEGILQITPESIESFFINRTSYLSDIFKNLSFIVIDEIHSYTNSERGVQLRSLLSRVETYTMIRPRIIGLSATIDNFDLVKKWINYQAPDNVEIVDEKGSDKQLLYHLMHFETDKSQQKPLELFEDIRELTKNQKAIIFCNNRGEVEEATYLLNRLAEKNKVSEAYYAHHSSIDKNEREYVEMIMTKTTIPKSVIATSSLELGIDIGDVDIVIQIDSTFTVSSLKQRLGRSGRKSEAKQMLQLYSTSDVSFLQSLAVMELNLTKWIEPASGYPRPFDVLFHQILSICQEKNGVILEELLQLLKKNHAFYSLDVQDVKKCILFMIKNDHLELIKGSSELIVGIDGERILRSKDFYAVFMNPIEFDVLNATKKIGTIGESAKIGDNIILSGKLWTIYDVNYEKKKVYVQKTVNGNKPIFNGGGMKIYKRIPERMLEILCSNEEFSYIDEMAKSTLQYLRNSYHKHDVKDNQRIIWKDKDSMIFETFTGTTIARTLDWVLRSVGINAKIIHGDPRGRILIKGNYDIIKILGGIKYMNLNPKTLISHTLPGEFFISKFSEYLPEDIQLEMHIANEIDVDGLRGFLLKYSFRIIEIS